MPVETLSEDLVTLESESCGKGVSGHMLPCMKKACCEGNGTVRE